MWKVFGNVLETADINGTSKSQAMKIRTNSNVVVKAIRTWFVFFNDPSFSSLSLRLYEDQAGQAGKLIATSTNSFTLAQVFTDSATNDYALKGLYFEFNEISLKATSYYHVLPYASAYTGTDASHIAWAKGWPDNEYRTGLTLTYEEAAASPYRFAVVGASL